MYLSPPHLLRALLFFCSTYVIVEYARTTAGPQGMAMGCAGFAVFSYAIDALGFGHMGE